MPLKDVLFHSPPRFRAVLGFITLLLVSTAMAGCVASPRTEERQPPTEPNHDPSRIGQEQDPAGQTNVDAGSPSERRIYVQEQRIDHEGNPVAETRTANLTYEGVNSMIDKWGRPVEAYNFTYSSYFSSVHDEGGARGHDVSYYFGRDSGAIIGVRWLVTGELFYEYEPSFPLPARDSALFAFMLTRLLPEIRDGADVSIDGVKFTLRRADGVEFLDADGCDLYELVRTPETSTRLFTCFTSDGWVPWVSAELSPWGMTSFHLEPNRPDALAALNGTISPSSAPPTFAGRPWLEVPAGDGIVPLPEVWVPPMGARPRGDELAEAVKALALDPKFSLFRANATAPYLSDGVWLQGMEDDFVGDYMLTIADGPDRYYTGVVETGVANPLIRTYLPLTPSGNEHDGGGLWFGPVIVHPPAFVVYPGRTEISPDVVPLGDLEKTYVDVLPSFGEWRHWQVHSSSRSCGDPCAFTDHESAGSMVWALVDDCVRHEGAKFAVVSGVNGQLLVTGPVVPISFGENKLCTFVLPE